MNSNMFQQQTDETLFILTLNEQQQHSRKNIESESVKTNQISIIFTQFPINL